MKILIVHQYFKTPTQGGGVRSFYIADALAKAGHQVTVITGGEQAEKISQFGFEVHYFDIPYSNYFGFFKRIRAFFLFVIKTRQFIKNDHQYDLGYVMSTPLTTAYIALHMKKRYRIPYCFEVGDLWPLVPKGLGLIKNKWILDYLFDLERKVYAKALELIALSPSQKDAMEYVDNYQKKVHVAPNMADIDFFHPSYLGDVTFTKQFPLQVSYFGTLGYANHVDFFVELARESEIRNLPIEYNIMGDGAMRNALIQKSTGIKSLNWYDAGGLNDVKKLMAKTQVAYITYLDNPILNTGCPNKLFDALAAGKLVVINFDGWMKDLIVNHECGFSYSPHAPEQYFSRIIQYIDSPLLLETHQANARQLAEYKFSTETITRRIVSLIEKSAQ